MKSILQSAWDCCPYQLHQAAEFDVLPYSIPNESEGRFCFSDVPSLASMTSPRNVTCSSCLTCRKAIVINLS